MSNIFELLAWNPKGPYNIFKVYRCIMPALVQANIDIKSGSGRKGEIKNHNLLNFAPAVVGNSR